MKPNYEITGKQYINGKWITGTSKRIYENINPYDQSKLMEFPLASTAEVDKAYDAATKAYESWSKVSATERGQIIQNIANLIMERKDEIIEWLIKESGSTRMKAEGECFGSHKIVTSWIHMANHVSGEILTDDRPNKYSFVFRESLGVIGVISPWNYPLILSIRSVIPAIVLGNTVVLKPASDTAVTGALLIAHLLEEAGVPEGVFNVVVGSGSEIGDYFVNHPIPRLISFTGSTEVGKRVGEKAITGENIKRLALELGGNSPFVVLDDANLEAAAGSATIGRFFHQGQICMSVNRIIVDQSVSKEFIKLFVEQVKGLKVGNPADPDTIIGPIINKQQMDSLTQKIHQANLDGINQLLGGDPEGQILPPHIFSPVDHSHFLCQEESFGPLAPITIAENEAHALNIANDTNYGLSSSVFTENMDRGLNFARGIYAGMTHINDMTVDDQPMAPFGGEKNSGLGRFNGQYLLDEFTRPHWITWQGTSEKP